MESVERLEAPLEPQGLGDCGYDNGARAGVLRILERSSIQFQRSRRHSLLRSKDTRPREAVATAKIPSGSLSDIQGSATMLLCLSSSISAHGTVDGYDSIVATELYPKPSSSDRSCAG